MSRGTRPWPRGGSVPPRRRSRTGCRAPRDPPRRGRVVRQRHRSAGGSALDAGAPARVCRRHRGARGARTSSPQGSDTLTDRAGGKRAAPAGRQNLAVDAIRYKPPRSVAEAVRLMAADSGARVLAGGTDLLVQFRAGVRQPSAFVNVKRIPELMSITIDDQGLRLGAAAPAAVVGEHAELRRLWAGLAESVR